MHSNLSEPIDFDAVFAASPTPTCVSLKRTILACNNAAASLFAYTPDAMVGESYAMLYPSSVEFERYKLQIDEALEVNGLYRGERIMRRCQGELFWCRVHAIAMKVRNGERQDIWTFGEVKSHNNIYQSLSPREREVAALVVAGNTSKMIAGKVGLSPRTVEFYRRGLMQKLSATSLSELVRMLTSDLTTKYRGRCHQSGSPL